ncbi:MAG: OsmC family protein [Ferruginibacter sp.]
MTAHIVKTTWIDGMQFDGLINNHHVIMDDGEYDLGPSPKRLMLASLGGCTGMDVVMILNKMRVEYSHFSVEVEAEVADEYPKIYNKVLLTYRIKMEKGNHAQMEKAIKLSQDKYCSVSAMFKSFAVLSTKVEYL